jgi:hypothetical protein
MAELRILHWIPNANLVTFQVRLFKDIDLEKLEYTTFDGWSRLEPQYGAE